MARRLPLPVVNPAGDIYPHLGRHATMLVMTAFHQIGGVERLADWADKNVGEFYTKLFSKVVTRPVEIQASEGVEALLERLEATERDEREATIDITPVEVAG